MADRGEVLVHVPNSGRLTGCARPGARCWLAAVRDRKLPYRLELLEADDGVLVGVNTQRSNALALEALERGVATLPGLCPPFVAERERAPLPGVRFDLCLRDGNGPYWVEVKNITFVVDGEALFPDAVTSRGARHVRLLAGLARTGARAAVLYVVQRGDARHVRAAAEVDPAYAEAAREAAEAGVAFVGLRVAVRLDALEPVGVLPVVDGARPAARMGA